MATRRVYVLWVHPIFRESVYLLLKHPEVTWVGANSDYAEAQEEITRQKPDVILVEKVEGVEPSEIQEILENTPWRVDVIELSLTDNRLSLYHREQREVSQADDLLNIILESSSTTRE
jgi:hypothetical protein